MPFVCAASGCLNISNKNGEFAFYKTPKVIRNQGEATERLSAERRRLWKELLNRPHLTDEQWEKVFVCSKHFEGGAKGYLHHRDKPGWLPTLHLTDPSTFIDDITRKSEYAEPVHGKTRKLKVSIDDKIGKEAVTIDNEARIKEVAVDDITNKQETPVGVKTRRCEVSSDNQTGKQEVHVGDKTRKRTMKTGKPEVNLDNKTGKRGVSVDNKSRKQIVPVSNKSRKKVMTITNKTMKRAEPFGNKTRKRALTIAKKPKYWGRNIQMELPRNDHTYVDPLLLDKEKEIGIAADEQTNWLSSVEMATSVKCEGSSTGWDKSACGVDFDSADFEFACESFTIKTEIESDEAYGGNNQFECDKETILNDTSGSETFRNKDLYFFTFYETETEMVNCYTGLPNFGVLMMLLKLVEEGLVFGPRLLTKENQLLLCLIKMRINNEFRDISFALDTSIETVQICFHNTLDLLYKRLNFLLRWPSRENLQKSVPMCFMNNFGAEKVVITLDSFQLFTEWGLNSLEHNESSLDSTWCLNTLTYLIGTTAHGQVTFISAGFSGLTSDKNLTEQSGILDELLPDDIVMVEKSFTPEGIITFFQTRQNFSQGRGKHKLHLVDVENAPNMVPVRPHVERVIGTMVQRFCILGGTVPIGYVKPKTGETVPTIDKLVQVACCLTNLCGTFQEI